MNFKEPRLSEQFDKMPDLLKEISYEFAFMSYAMGIAPIVTRITDPVEGESGVHLANRAIDFRDEHKGVSLYDKSDVMFLLQYFNGKYARNDNFHTLIWHAFNGMPKHFHIQIAATKAQYVNRSKFVSLRVK